MRDRERRRPRRKTGPVIFLLLAFVVGTVLLTVVDWDKKERNVRSSSSRTTVTTAGTTTTTRGQVNYTVRAGDTLLLIAERFAVTQQAIIKANGLFNPDDIKVGQVLVIPPEPVVRLVIRPRKATVGETISLSLEGAQPSEYITFQIRKPNGSTFSGQPHYSSTDGDVSTTYQLSATDPPGTYTVIATGDQITRAERTFTVVAPPPPTTAG